MYDFAISNIQGYMRNSTAIKDKISDFHLAQISLLGCTVLSYCHSRQLIAKVCKYRHHESRYTVN